MHTIVQNGKKHLSDMRAEAMEQMAGQLPEQEDEELTPKELSYKIKK